LLLHSHGTAFMLLPELIENNVYDKCSRISDVMELMSYLPPG